MDIINRSVIIVYAKEKFESWLNERLVQDNEDVLSLAEINASPSVFLIPEFDDEEEAYDYLVSHTEEFFLAMVNAWVDDRRPIELVFENEDFFEWFDIVFSPMTFDLDYTPIVKDAFEVSED